MRAQSRTASRREHDTAPGDPTVVHCHVRPHRTRRLPRGSCATHTVAVKRVFLLSPASCTGKRTAMLLRDGAGFPLARALRTPAGAPIADVFQFTSGLYFRGKVTYARAFADPPAGAPAMLVITSARGLIGPDSPITTTDLRRFAAVPIATSSGVYRRALIRSAQRLERMLSADAAIILLGSIASGKYADLLLDVFGERLLFPAAFVGRGDMSRGGLMLRAAESGDELAYAALAGAQRHGPRPPRLAPLRKAQRS